MIEIRYHKNVLLFLDELTDILIDKGYFSFYEYSVKYVENLVCYVKEYIDLLPHRKTPDYFSKYGDNLFYITYKKNKRTTWYILFQKTKQYYFIRHITNNHTDEYQYFNLY
jgi:hypothetical protein